jgi:hypothetical protein
MALDPPSPWRMPWGPHLLRRLAQHQRHLGPHGRERALLQLPELAAVGGRVRVLGHANISRTSAGLNAARRGGGATGQPGSQAQQNGTEIVVVKPNRTAQRLLWVSRTARRGIRQTPGQVGTRNERKDGQNTALAGG